MSQIAELERTNTRVAVSQLEQLKRLTRVVADTGDYETLKEYGPEDATTNPSLILKAAGMPDYKSLVDRAITEGKQSGQAGPALLSRIMDNLLVLFGVEILKIVPGRVFDRNGRRPFL